MKQLRVGKDLDGVHYLFDHAWWLGMNTLDPTWGETNPYVAAAHWDFYENYGLNVPGFLDACHRLADADLLWMQPPIEGAVEAWQRIEGDGHEIHVGTDRSFGKFPVVSQRSTFAWLDAHDLWCDSVTFTADKTALDVDVMIEDKRENYDAREAAGQLTFLINRPWNEDPGDSRRRIDTLDDWVGVVRDLAADRRVFV